MWFLNFILNQSGVPAFSAGTLANRPAAGYIGRIYISTDTFAFYRDTGAGWDLIGGPGTGTITGSLTANQVVYATGTNTIGGNANFTYDGINVAIANDATVNGLTVGKGLGAIVTNSVFGIDALDANTTGYSNIAIGNKAMFRNTTGFLNIAIGNQAIENSQTGYANIAIGDFSLNELSTGYYNIAIGRNTLAKNTTAFTNIAIGDGTLRQTTTGSSNVAVGNDALFSNITGGSNVAIGVNAGSHVKGSGNIIIGINAGNDGTLTGNTNNSIFIGNTAQPNATGQTNQIVIGDGVTGNGSNTVTIGNSSIVNTYLQGTVNASNVAVTKSNSGIALNITDSANGNALNISKSGSGFAINVSSGVTSLLDTTVTLIQSTGTIRTTGATGGLLGQGGEFRYNAGSVEILAFDRTLLTYLPFVLNASKISLGVAGSGCNVTIRTAVDNGIDALQVTGSILASSYIQTGAPVAGTSGKWKLGIYVAGAPASTGYIQLEINGVLYKLVTST